MTTTPPADNSGDSAVELRPAVVNIRRIMVPLDFSAHSHKALLYGVKLAQQFGSELELVHVVTPVVYAEGMVLPAAMENLDRETEQHARQELAKLVAREDVAPLKHKTTILTGTPYDEIVTHARKHETDLLLITTHGRTGLQHFLLGSTAEKILRHAPCPVMVVRDKEHEFV